MSLTRSLELWRQYVSAFRRDAHQLLEWGYVDARAELSSDLDEPTITGLIAEAIRRRLSGSAPRRYDRYFLADDLPQEGEQRTGIRRLRVDIVVERSGTRPRLHYIMEAKRLRRGSHSIGQYIGGDGLQRFLRGSYAANALEAAMVGYVQSESVETWAKQLEEASGLSTDNSLDVVERLWRLGPLGELKHRWSSTHMRSSGTEITICHILLACL